MTHTRCKIIGLTGGIATGKSTVSNFLLEKGYMVIDADKLARKIVQINEPAYKEIVNYFGKGILNEDKSINRKSLGRLIFSDDKSKSKLNDITHPYIFHKMKIELIEKCKENKVVFLDIPLLFEEYNNILKSGIEFDEIWLVYLGEKAQINRLMERDGLDLEESQKRIGSQMPLSIKREKAHIIIDNSNDKSALEYSVIKALANL